MMVRWIQLTLLVLFSTLVSVGTAEVSVNTSRHLLIHVCDADTTSPITSFRYHLEDTGYSDTITSGTISSPTGELRLGPMRELPDWIEVAELNDSGERTGRWNRISLFESRRAADDPSELETSIHLHRPRTVRGTVTHKTTGRPVPGVEVRWMPPEEEPWAPQADPFFPPPTSMSDPNGRFELHGVPPGIARIRAVALREAAPMEVQVVVPERGEPESLAMELDPASVIQGIALDANGAPIADAEVWCVLHVPESENDPDSISSQYWWTSRTNVDGTFTFPAVPASAGSVILDPRSDHSREQPVVVEEGQTFHLTFDASRLATVSLNSPSVPPASLAMVELYDEKNVRVYRQRLALGSSIRGAIQIPPGSYRCVVVAEDLFATLPEEIEVLTEGTSHDIVLPDRYARVTVQLDPAFADMHSVQTIFVRPLGLPPEVGRVLWTHDGGTVWLGPGEYRIRAYESLKREELVAEQVLTIGSQSELTINLASIPAIK